MAMNHAFVFDNTYPVPVASTVLGGDIVKVGSLVGVAQFPPVQGDIPGAAGLKSTVYLNGIHRFQTIAGATGVFTVGQKVYVTSADVAAGAGTQTVTNVSAAGTYIGVAVEAKATGAGDVWVLINYPEGA